MFKLFVGTVKGGFVFSSSDRRQWSDPKTIFRGWKVSAAGRSRSGRYLAGVSSWVYGTTVQLSDDLENWEQMENGPSYDSESGRKLDEIWRFNTAADTLYAGVSEAGLFASRDDGVTWHGIDGLNDHSTRSQWQPGFGGLCAHAILVDPKNPNRIWCGISAVGVFRSDDGGQTWIPKNRGIAKVVEDEKESEIGFCVHGLAADPDNADIIYRQDHAGMYRSSDGGDSWQKNEDGLPSGFGFPIAIDQNSKALFAFPQESGEYRMPPDRRFQVYRSLDEGDSWHPSGSTDGPTSLAGVLRGAMAVDSADPCGVYAGTTSGTVHVSADGGDSWTELPVTLPRILCVEVFADA